MNSSPPPTATRECDFYLQSEPEVCADSGGGRAFFTFHPAVLGLFVPPLRSLVILMNALYEYKA